MSDLGFSKDIREFIELLAKYRVRYLLVGGNAVIFHGYARYTGDVDFFYAMDDANTKKLFTALQEYWGGNVPFVARETDLRVEGQIIQFGVPPFRIDLINRIDGVTFEEAYATAISETIPHGKEVLPIKIISLDMLKKNKIASARIKDIEDVQKLKG
ncbi:MAG: hypothetical protein LDLANPLL_02714 [Turneriella sp.]|nr:hypothetical protein [Turneriella sp.]